jgi:hypothetical protein
LIRDVRLTPMTTSSASSEAVAGFIRGTGEQVLLDLSQRGARQGGDADESARNLERSQLRAEVLRRAIEVVVREQRRPTAPRRAPDPPRRRPPLYARLSGCTVPQSRGGTD